MSRHGVPKYQPLREYLAAQPGAQLTLTFAAIEAIIGAPLPPMAAHSRSWWANTVSGDPQARAWGGDGWRVTAVNFGLRRVVFERREESR